MKRTTASCVTIAALLLAALCLPASGSAAASSVAPPDKGDHRVSAQERATRALQSHRAAFRAASKDTFTVAGKTILDRDGGAHVRLERRYAGLPVLGGDTVAHLDAAGNLESTSLTLRTALAVSTTARISQAAAVRTALTAYDGTRDSVSARQVVDAVGATPALAWEVEIHGTRADQTPSRFHAIVDASTGALRRTFDEIVKATGTGRSKYSGTVRIATSGTPGGYVLKDPTRGNGETTDLWGLTSDFATGFSITDADNVWGNGAMSDRASAAVDAHYGAQVTYDFYKNVLGRSGIFNDGRGVRSRVHYGDEYENAFWDGVQMTYGDGLGNSRPLVSIDIAGHEMTHGVTQHSAGLIYSGESGGLNEATSDIFGTMVEFYAANPADRGDYLIGEKLGTPLRYMDRPSRDGRSRDCWSPSLGDLNPHFSSGPANHLFYLLSEGSGTKTINGVAYNSPTCHGSAVAGIGRAAAGAIWYRALSAYMTSGTSYAGARQAAVRAAIDLYGAASTQCAAVEKAFSAISVVGATCGATTPPPTGANILRNPGFESGGASWTATKGVIGAGAAKARSGTGLAVLNGYGPTHKESVAQRVALPPGRSASLSLWLRIASSETTKTRADDTLKIQVISGTRTTTLATYSNLTKWKGYARKTFDLSAYAGESVTVRLLSAEDSTAVTHFFADDLTVTTNYELAPTRRG